MRVGLKYTYIQLPPEDLHTLYQLSEKKRLWLPCFPHFICGRRMRRCKWLGPSSRVNSALSSWICLWISLADVQWAANLSFQVNAACTCTHSHTPSQHLSQALSHRPGQPPIVPPASQVTSKTETDEKRLGERPCPCSAQHWLIQTDWSRMTLNSPPPLPFQALNSAVFSRMHLWCLYIVLMLQPEHKLVNLPSIWAPDVSADGWLGGDAKQNVLHSRTTLFTAYRKAREKKKSMSL